MDEGRLGTLERGAIAGLAASTAQAAVGKALDLLLLPSWEDSHIAPRLVDRVGRDAGVETSPTEEWTLGTLFHYGYGAAWGAGYAAVRERLGFPPLAGGLLLGATIWSITFPRFGGAVRLGVERPPERRTAGMEVVAGAVCLAFGLTTALLEDRLRRAR